MIDPKTLLPCPFCGSTDLENLDAAYETFSPVMCIRCGARGPCRPRGLEASADLGGQPPLENGLDAWDERR